MHNLSPPPSIAATSPLLRPLSPSPSTSPSLALGACPSLDRSASAPSTISSRSVSSGSQPSDSGSNPRRRNGFMRPQGTSFADSARARDSVMCLGSIAALQYYFARTGLLDGKGAQMAKDGKIKPDPAAAASAGGDSAGDQESDGFWEYMAAPAVSTYRHKEHTTEPLPDLPVLRRQLREALEEARKVLEKCTQEDVEGESYQHEVKITDDPSKPRSWHEVQGLNILDVVTLSIRQARTYYVTHARPQNLYALRPEKEIRADLYQVLDILKRMASRDFRGGIRQDERSGILSWIQSIHDLLTQEEGQEAEELARRKQWPWLDGDWQGREREREWAFLNSFDSELPPLPAWEPPSSEPSEFLLSLSKGLRLINLHNEMVRRSRRRFGEITTFYTDLAKPYRCAENLRYWAKAAELRWEIKLNFDALNVVNGKDEQAWLLFDKALMLWSRNVREELSKEWADVKSGPDVRHHAMCGAPDDKVVIAF